MSHGSAELQHFTFEAWQLVPADAAPEGLPAPRPAVAVPLCWLPASSAVIDVTKDVPSDHSAAPYHQTSIETCLVSGSIYVCVHADACCTVHEYKM